MLYKAEASAYVHTYTGSINEGSLNGEDSDDGKAKRSKADRLLKMMDGHALEQSFASVQVPSDGDPLAPPVSCLEEFPLPPKKI